MDQSKWSLPRSKVLTKNLAKFERPRAKIQAVWCHNLCLCLFILDPRVHTDASMVIECICRALEKAAAVCERHGKSLPRRLLLWVLWLVMMHAIKTQIAVVNCSRPFFL